MVDKARAIHLEGAGHRHESRHLPRLVIRKYTISPIRAYDSKAPPGPAEATVAPDARNSPVPMEPPMAIMDK
jgi:hypothetical protein